MATTKKTIITKKMKCVTINLTPNRSNVVLAEEITQTEKGAQAKNMFSLGFTDAKEAQAFEVNAEYTITIEK